MNCDGCDIELGIEGTVTIDKRDSEVVYYLCGFCADKVENYILKQLP